MSGKQLLRKLLVHAVEHARAVASALILAGYVGFFLLPLASRDNFFDENSLLVANSAPDVGYVRQLTGSWTCLPIFSQHAPPSSLF